MKKLVYILFLVFISNITLGQDFRKLADYEFKTSEDYAKAEGDVLLAANYLFDTPAISENDNNRLISVRFILMWMEGTHYSFELDERSTELTNGNDDLLSLLLAGMSKVVLDNKGTDLSANEIYQKTEKRIVDYCADKANNMKPSKKIKSLIKSQK